MFCNGFLGVLLHLSIDSRAYAQTIGVQIVLGSVRLEVLVEPAVQLVVRPLERIDYIILLEIIICPLRLLGVHGTQEHILEVQSQASMVVLPCI